MFEDAIERSGFFWQFIHQYQALLAGWLTLIAGLFALAAAWAIVKEGKRQRAFKMNQYKIEVQNKRRAVAVMVASDMRSIVDIADCKGLAKKAEQHAEKLKRLDDGESYSIPLFPPIDKSFLNNYSNYTENMPLMHVETVKEVSRLYMFATTLSEVIALSNAKMEGKEANTTRASFLRGLSRFANVTHTQFDKILPLLKQEVDEAEKELDRLNGVKEKPDARTP